MIEKLKERIKQIDAELQYQGGRRVVELMVERADCVNQIGKIELEEKLDKILHILEVQEEREKQKQIALTVKSLTAGDKTTTDSAWTKFYKEQGIW